MSKIHSIFPKPVFLGSSVRTPIGRFGGSLKRFSAPELATLCLKESLRRASNVMDSTPDLVVLGHARQAGARPNPARQAALFSGLPDTVPAITLNQACASGLASVIFGAEKIALGRARTVFAGGVESMSNTPYYLMDGRWGLRMGHAEVVDGMTRDGFHCPMADMLMGATVDTFLARESGISRQEQDAYALLSQQRAEHSWKNGLFAAETFSIEGEGKLPGLAEDEHRRGTTTLESLGKLPPVFDREKGTVTAGNSSGITDGSAFVRISDARDPGMEAEVLDYEMVGLDPRRMGLGPIEATRRLLERQGLQVGDLEAVELNEAFAAQVLACNRELRIAEDRLNVRGGAIAIGHPIGATGTRILVTLTHILKGKPGALGVATLCVSGGQGFAVLLRGL